jgi:2-oxoglutarate dehydrogenase E2 component (dihydrolipoamide succinyltransferase)
MSVSVTMPRLGESVSEGTVTRWLKKEGDRVEADEPLLEVSTDKVDTEIPSPAAGVLQSIKVNEDETVEVGTELAVIGDSADGGGSGGGDSGGGDAEPAAEAATEAPSTEATPPEAPSTEVEEEEPAPESAAETQATERAAPAAAEQPAPPQPPAQQQPAEPARPAAPQQASVPQASAPAASAAATADGGDAASYVTPLVRRLAAEQGVDLGQVQGTGVGGRIRKQDVLDAARATRPEAPAAGGGSPAARAAGSGGASPAASVAVRGRTEKMSRLRSVIATRMVESLQVSAQLTTVLEVDVTRITTLRDRAKAAFEAREGVKLTFLPFFAIATCEALKAHPTVNASIDVEKGEITYHDAEHLGIAVDTDRGLLAPVIRDAGDLNLGGMARKIADLAERTRTGQVTPDELGGGTFTLTNTGSRGALFDTPIINQPQVGILGTGAVVKRAVVVADPTLGDSIAVRSMVYLALTYDHRLVDGADAARFLVTVKDRLEEGAFDADLGL